MRIVFLNRSYWPDVGATGQLLSELASELVSGHGAEVTVIAGGKAGGSAAAKGRGRGRGRGLGLASRERHEGVTILRARGTHFDRRGFAGRFSNYVTYFLSSIWASFQVGKPDVVVALTDPPIIGLVGWLTARRTGARFVFLCQDIFPEVANLLADFRSGLVNGVLERVNRFLVERADRVVALGECMKKRLVEGKGARPERVAVIHNWADSSVFAPAPKDNPFSREHGLNDTFVVMHSGNMGLSQNLDMLVEAASALKDVEDLSFLMVGDGVRQEPLEELARAHGLERFRFLPYQPRERLNESYATADVFIVSLLQGLAGYIVPSKLYGILASGRPYVAAVEEDSEVAQITRHHDCGLLVAPGDVGGMVHAIERLHRDPALVRRLGENARLASADFEREKQVRAYHRLFEELLPEKRVGADAAREARV